MNLSSYSAQRSATAASAAVGDSYPGRNMSSKNFNINLNLTNPNPHPHQQIRWNQPNNNHHHHHHQAVISSGSACLHRNSLSNSSAKPSPPPPPPSAPLRFSSGNHFTGKYRLRKRLSGFN